MSRNLIIGIAALLLATVIAYIPVYSAGFIWDDDDYVLNNPTLRSAGGLWRMWTEPGAIPQYYPATHSTFWLENQLCRNKPNPTLFHVNNVLLHATSAILLWFVLRRLRMPGAWVVAAVFALHPVHVESAAWITERKNTLSAFFYFISLLAYLHFRPIEGTRENTPTTDNWFLYVVALVAFVAALLSKSVTCSLPAAILLLIWWKRGRIGIRDFAPLVPFFVIGVGMATITAWVEREHVGAMGDEWAFTMLDRVLIAGRAVWFYACKLVWPMDLAFIYTRWDIDTAVMWQWAFPTAAIVLLFVLWLLRKRIGRGPLVAMLFFGGTLLPALGFVNIYPMRYAFVADHFQYLASLGVITLLVSACAATFRSMGTSGTYIGVTCAALVLPFLGVRTWQQTHIYKDLETLWRDTLDKTPTAVIAMNNLGQILMHTERADEAIPILSRAVELRPDDVKYRNNLATAYLNAGRDHDARRTYQEALAVDSDSLLTNRNLGSFHGQRGELDLAIKYFQHAARTGIAMRERGDRITRNEGNNLVAAQTLLAQAVTQQTEKLIANRQRPRAITLLRDNLPLMPAAYEPRKRLADLLYDGNQAEEAIALYRECVQVNPKAHDVLNALAWILATHPNDTIRNGEDAVGFAQLAIQLVDMKASYYDSLGAALAETGAFNKAIEAARHARELARRSGNAGLARRIDARIQLYTAKRPYREPQ